ncbi:MAG: RrF2 family transcriptional regulator [Hyalangium sp.]|uniref:RrF2 family transcriptional regulator n=1 Tax=Hyalangium sp. TaxID=2028555 RepID=UPI00389A8171
MHLTLHADYSLRVLLYLAAQPERLASTQEVSEAYGISKNHLVRVVQSLGRHGFIEVRPGRAGGILLARPASEISLGQVFRVAEPDFNLVECFDRDKNTCPIAPACGLRGVLFEAREAFLAVLDKYTVADLVKRSRKDLRDFFLPAGADSSP